MNTDYERRVTTFRKVHVEAAASGRCPVCDKRVRRTRTFTQTVNPYNKNPDGSVRTPSEVYEAVKAEAKAWEPDFTHGRCL